MHDRILLPGTHASCDLATAVWLQADISQSTCHAAFSDVDLWLLVGL